MVHWGRSPEKVMATHSSILAWRIPRTAEPGGLPSMGSHRVGHDWSDLAAAAGSVSKSCPALCNPMACNTSGSSILHYIPEIVEIHFHWVGDAILILSSSSPCAFSLSQHKSLFQLVGSSHQMDKVLELQLQPQSLQWIFTIDFH